MPLTVVDPATSLPVDLTELKGHLRIGGGSPGNYTAEDYTLTLMVSAAALAWQERYKVQLVTATLRWDFKTFSREMELPRPPFQKIVSLKYVDVDNVEQTIDEADYSVFSFDRLPGRIVFADEYEFPEDLNEMDPYPVKVTYKAGYSSGPEKVPDPIKLWLMNTVGTYYMQRESKVVSYSGSVSISEMKSEMASLLSGAPKAMRVG